MSVAPSSRVATVLPNQPETAVAILALAATGTVMPLNPVLAPEELRRTLRDGGAEFVLTSPAHADAIAAAGELDLGLVLLRPQFARHTGAFELEARRSGRPPHSSEPSVALILSTSGSTGTPKRVPLTSHSLVQSSHNVTVSLELTPADTCLNMMPMFHIGALVDLLLAPLSAGGCIAFANAISADAFWRGLGEFNPTWSQAVPTMLRDLLRSLPTDDDIGRLAKLRFVRAVSQPLPPDLREEFQEKFKVPLLPIFGMTETSGLITSVPLDRLTQKPGSVGIPFGSELKIVDPSGADLPALAKGEVLVRGPTVMAGYEGGDPRPPFLCDEWLCSGDEGYLDLDGYLFLTGRLKDIINRGGEKIAPLEIDQVAESHPLIREAAAFAVPHSSLGEDVALAAVPDRGAKLTEEALRAWLGERLAEFKVPRRILLLARLPRLPSGKLDRRGLIPLLDKPAVSRPELPTSRLGQAIARVWERTLRVPGITVDEDFFELGGDSLSATTFIIWLEQKVGAELPPSLLFDAPTIRKIEALLARGVALQHCEVPSLRKGVARTLRHATAAWEGERQDAAGLILGRNLEGSSAPFFWVCQGLEQFQPMAHRLPNDRPLYVLRSLSNTRFKSDTNTRQLAAYYACELDRLQPEGPLLLGGFCQGGLMAFRIAQALQRRGREIGLLVLQDRFIPEPIDAPMALFNGRRGWFCAYDLADDPRRGWAKFYSGPLSVFRTEADHPDLHSEPYVAEFAAQLETVLAGAKGGDVANDGRSAPPLAPLDQRALKRRLRARVPLWLHQGSEHELEVRVTNTSPVAWERTETSGIILASRWRGFDLDHPWLLDGRIPLSQAVAPGESVDLTLPIRVPIRSLPMLLEIDLVEDGYRWFGRERPLARHVHLVLPRTPTMLL